MVKHDHHTTIRVRTRRGPIRSPHQALTTSKAAYATAKTLNTRLISTRLRRKSRAISGARTEMQTRSRYVTAASSIRNAAARYRVRVGAMDGASGSGEQRADLLRRSRELADFGAHDFVREGQVDVAHRARDARVPALRESARASGNDHRQAAVLVRIRLGVLMDIHQAGVVEEIAFAFRNGLQLRDEVRKLLHVPLADVTQDALSFHAVRARRLAVGMRVIVVPRRSVAEPRKARKSLAFGQHVRRHASLAGGQGLRQQVALEFRDPRPVLHIAVEIRRIDAVVLGWKAGDGALEVADAGEMLVEAGLVVRGKLLFQQVGVLPDGVEDAALAMDPTFFALAEETIEELVRDHLRRQRPLVSGPAHI